MTIFSPVITASLTNLRAASATAPRPAWLDRFRNRHRRATTFTPDAAALHADVRRARILANWLDTKFTVAGYRFGFDAILGLVPVAGDTLAAAAACYPIYVARRHRLGRASQLRMLANVALDWLIGLVPILGDWFDTAFKANVRNVTLLERAVARRAETRMSKPE